MGAFGGIVLLVVIGTTIWVGVDASRRDWGKGSGTATWVLGCVLLWIVVFPWYLAKRGNAPLKEQAQVRGQVYALTPAGQTTGPANLTATHRTCPHCKEPMRRDADTCPHCRKESTPWQLHDGRWWFRSDENSPWQWLDDRTGSWQLLEPPREDAALQLAAGNPPTG